MKSLEELRIDDNYDIGNIGLRYLSELSKIQKITIKNNFNVNEIQGEWISLYSLDLDRCNLRDSGPKSLPKGLTNLTISVNDIGPEGARHIFTGNFELKFLDLRSNHIGDRGLLYLINNSLKNLEELIIDDNKITNQGVYAMSGFYYPKLKILSLRENDIDYQGEIYLKKRMDSLQIYL